MSDDRWYGRNAAMNDYATAPLPRRRTRRRGRGLLIALLVLVLLLIAADRIGVLFADRAIADRVQSSQDLNRKPDVHINGFPFLTQVANNDYRKITVDANRLTVGQNDKRVTLDTLVATLTGVRAVDNYSAATAQHVSATARVGYPQLSQLLGVPISYASGGRVQASRSVTVLGRTLTGTVSAVVTVPGGDALAFTDVRVGTDAGSLGVPQAVTSQLTDVFSQQLSLAGLPFGMRVRDLDVSRAGVTITATAEGVRLG